MHKINSKFQNSFILLSRVFCEVPNYTFVFNVCQFVNLSVLNEITFLKKMNRAILQVKNTILKVYCNIMLIDSAKCF